MGDRFDAKKFWLFRLENIFKIITSGINVIHSDLDAVWVKNPVEKFIYKNNKYDIISSIAHKKSAHPKEVRKKIGFTLCMGFIFFRSCTRTISFFKSLLDNFDATDQATLNNVLADSNPTISSLTIGGINDNFLIETNKLNIMGLSKNIILRDNIFININSNIYVCHPNGGKTCNKTKNILKKCNLWMPYKK